MKLFCGCTIWHLNDILFTWGLVTVFAQVGRSLQRVKVAVRLAAERALKHPAASPCCAAATRVNALMRSVPLRDPA